LEIVDRHALRIRELCDAALHYDIPHRELHPLQAELF
jgi:hypothetical protein